MASSRARSHRVQVENDMIRRREKQFRHDETWNGRKQYYEHWEKNNAKFDEWTSPRYHENQNRMIEKMKKDRDHEESLAKRRDKLRAMLNEEEQLYRVEVMVHKTRNSPFYGRSQVGEVPTEVLKELNAGLKLEEDERRRHDAELKLYHQWRNNNPVLRHYERMQRGRDLKLSWLDQQIENRMRREREEEECEKLLKEREKMLKVEEAREADERKQRQVKREELKATLDRQMEELKRKTEQSKELQAKEEEENRQRLELNRLELRRIEDEKKRIEKECALYNVKHYKMKLKKKAENIQSDLEQERGLIEKLKELEIADRIEDDAKREEIKEAILQFLELNEAQKNLEKCRQKHLDFLFDSEAKLQFEQQNEIWKQEELARTKLIKEVIDTIKTQIDANLEKNRKKQLEMVQEREEMVKQIEEYNREMEGLRVDEMRKKVVRMKSIDDDVKMKSLRKKARENAELRRIDDELERVRKEEERLKQEIMNIQRRQGPIRPARSKLFL